MFDWEPPPRSCSSFRSIRVTSALSSARRRPRLSMPGPGVEVITPAHWERLEEAIERFNENLEPLSNFILPGGSEAVSRCHLVRAVARRAERRYARLAATQFVNADSRIYLNRLSDLCFVAGRWLAKSNGEPEVLWQQNKPQPQ